MSTEVPLSLPSRPAAVPHRGAVAIAKHGNTLTPLFALTLFSSAALIFTIEPMFGKMVLPLLGGAPSVWNTCLMFFQAVLLGGYAYAHALTTRFGIRAQVGIHVGLLAAASLALPISIAEGWTPPVDSSPIGSLLMMLVLSVGGPLFVLCATAPLLQKWFAHTTDRSAKDPYFLYAASNAGSILALLAYPLLIEPASSLSLQSSRWSLAYFLLVALTLTCGVTAVLRERVGTQSSATPAVSHVTWLRRGRWLALSLVPSSLMMGVTTFLSTDIAAVPLLWTLPLTLYLLSFVFGFSAKAVVSRGFLRRTVLGLALLIALVLALGMSRPIWLMIPLHLLVLFVFALALHTELADDRPGTDRLTEFYLWIAAGGVLGGLFNSLIAPSVFNDVVEYPIAVAAACLLRPLLKPTPGARASAADWILPLSLGLATVVIVFTVHGRAGFAPALMFPTLAAVVFAYIKCTTPVRFAAAVPLILLAGYLARPEKGDLLYAGRTFFGVYRVWDVVEAGQHKLAHGTTMHGGQHTDPARRLEPVGYYHPTGPIGQIFTALGPRLDGAAIGVVGLGAGGLAAYARPGQMWTFYEIDPEVERIARNPRLFSYLDECGSACSVVLGDARLSLQRERSRPYDLMVLDAFSSDAIPVHLMTREALGVYLENLTDDGALVLHISNRYLRVAPILANLAAERRLMARVQFFKPDRPDNAKAESEWVVMARSDAALGALASDKRWVRMNGSPDVRAWTDDYSDILSVFHPR